MKDSRLIKRLGYLADQQGIIKRYLREGDSWDSHLARSKEYILRAVSKYKPETVTVLGSGWLLDVPLEELAGQLTRINLVDINHPRQIRRKVQQYDNVSLIEDDVTGGLLKSVWANRRKDVAGLNEIPLPLYKPDYESGYIISLMLLTQLDMLLFEYLANNFGISQDECHDFRRGVQERHIEFLQKHNSLLISETEEKLFRDNILLSSSDVLYTPFPEGSNIESWEWEFDTMGLYYNGKKVVFRVKAVEICGNGNN